MIARTRAGDSLSLGRVPAAQPYDVTVAALKFKLESVSEPGAAESGGGPAALHLGRQPGFL